MENYLNDYLRHLSVSRGFAQGTIRGQKNILLHFFKFLTQREITSLAAVTEKLIQKYTLNLYDYRQENGRALSRETIRHRLTVVCLFFRFVVKRGVLLVNPTRNIIFPKKEKRLPRTVLTADEMQKVLTGIKAHTFAGLRNRAMAELLYSSGLRRRELLNLCVSHIDLGKGLLQVHQGKGGKDRVIPVSDRAVYWLRRYLDKRREIVRTEKDLVFIAANGFPLDYSALDRIIGGAVHAADIGKHGGCHLFRHTCATLMVANGADLRSVQELLGHVNAETTTIYTRVTAADLREVYRKFHPLYLFEEQAKDWDFYFTEFLRAQNIKSKLFYASLRQRTQRFLTWLKSKDLPHFSSLTDFVFLEYYETIKILPTVAAERAQIFWCAVRFAEYLQQAGVPSLNLDFKALAKSLWRKERIRHVA